MNVNYGRRSTDRLPPPKPKLPLTIIAGIVTLITLLIVTVLAFSYSGNHLTDGQKDLVLLTIIGLVGNAIPSLLALLKSESTHHDIHNGVVKDKVKQAIEEVAEDTNAEGVYIRTERPTDGKA